MTLLLADIWDDRLKTMWVRCLWGGQTRHCEGASVCSHVTLSSTPQGRPWYSHWAGVSTLGSEFRSESNLQYHYLESIVTPGSFLVWYYFYYYYCYCPSKAWMKLVLSYTWLACFLWFVSSPSLLEDFVKLKKLELVIKMYKRLRYSSYFVLLQLRLRENCSGCE